MRPKPCSVAALALLPLLLAGCLQPGEPGEPIAAPPSPGAAVEGAPCASAWTTVRCQETGIVEVDGLGEACAVGARRCVDGRWGPCEGVEWVSADPLATTATGTEATGASRDALLGTPILCGGCDPDCYITSDCPSSADIGDATVEFDGTRFDPIAGGIVIGNPSKNARGRYAWISSHDANVVNKLDMETLRNVGVYRVGSSPSRTTLDANGHVYVGNRNSGDVTKIAATLGACVDRNGNGTIETSVGEDPPGSKSFDLRGPVTDLVSGDECIVWQRPVGPGDGAPRALAIDARNRLWVGLSDKQAYYVMDPATGNTIHGPIAVGHSPYGCGIAPDGRLWSGATSGRIQSIDTSAVTPTVADVGPLLTSPEGVYGIAIDGRNRVFVASGRKLSRYDPATDTWAVGATTGAKGLAVDAIGHVYVAGSNDNVVLEHDSESLLELQRWTVTSSPRGCAPDFWDRVWAANHGSANCAVIEVHSGVVQYVNTFGVNYTYSDFTGYGFTMFTNPAGHFVRLYDSYDTCGVGHDSYRARLHFEVETPDTTQVQFWARTADTIAGLEGAVDVLLGEVPSAATSFEVSRRLEAALQPPRARILEIRVTLLRGGSTLSPVLRSMVLEEYCR